MPRYFNIFHTYVGFWLVAALVVSGIDLYGAARYLGFEALCVLWPGLTVSVWLGVARSGATAFFFSYVLGSLCLVASVIAAGATGWWGFHIMPAVVALAGLMHASTRDRCVRLLRLATQPRSWWLPLGLLLAIFAAVKASVMPALGTYEYSYINQDILWNMGTALSLERSFPPQDFQAAGMPFGYHFFQNAWLAGAHRLSGLPLEDLFLRLHPLGLLHALAVGTYAAARSLGARRLGAAGAVVGSLVFMRGEFNTLVTTMVYETGGFAFSMAGLLATLLLAPRLLRPRHHAWPLAIATLSAALLMAGAKLAAAPVLIAAAGAAGLRALQTRSGLVPRLALWAGLIGAAAGVAYLTTMGGDVRSGGILEFHPFYTLRMQRWAEFEAIAHYPLAVVCLAYLIVQYWPVVTLAFLGAAPTTSARGRVMRALLVLLVATGITASVTFGHVGSSHLYFEYIAMLVLPIVVTTIRWRRGRHRILRVVWIGTLLVLGVVGLTALRDARHMTLSWQGTRNTPASTFVDDSVSRLQLEGLRYLRTQTPKDAVVAFNRRWTWPGYARYYYNTALGERRAYIAGPDYSAYGNLARLYARRGQAPIRTEYYDAMEQRLVNNDLLFSTTDPAEAARILTSAPIDYVFLDRQTTDTLGFPTEDLLEEQFRNAHVVVYAVVVASRAGRPEAH